MEDWSRNGPPREKITLLLARLGETETGDDTTRAATLATLVPLVYDELREIARRQMRGQPEGHTLNTTALVHEAYVKLAGPEDAKWNGRNHFLAVAALAMRQVLVNHAHRVLAAKRGGGQVVATLNEDVVAGARNHAARADELIALDRAMDRLAEHAPRQAEVVAYRYFGGLKNAEIAEVLGVSVPTVVRDWRLARAWLARELAQDD